MNGVLILNHHAGSLNGHRAAVPPEDVRRAFSAAGVSLSVRDGTPQDLRAIAADAIARQVDAVFVGGGDGTVGSAAQAFADSDVSLGVLPLGTHNHFARDLGLPVDWHEAVKALVGAVPQRVDLGEVNGRVFINNCSIGAYAAAVWRREALRREHGFGKKRAMLRATIDEFRQLRRMRIGVDTGETQFPLRTPFVVVANNRYSGHVLDYSKRPRLDEGRLWIYATRARTRFALLRLAWQALLHEIDAAEALEIHESTNATITCERGPPPVALDGEVVDLTPPFQFRTRPGALRVLMPREPVGQNGGAK